MAGIRRQLTLLVSEQHEAIENIRAKFNPKQYNLIPAHVTLFREDELDDIDRVKENLASIELPKPICIRFGAIERFSEGKGVLIPARGENEEFHQVRKHILKGIIDRPREHKPHITLMHPRNSTCTDEIFDQLTQYILPSKLCFDTIYLIEQEAGGTWRFLNAYKVA